MITADLSNIDVEIPEGSHINALRDTIQIIYTENTSNKVLTIPISNLIRNHVNPKHIHVEKESLYNCQCSCSDGITQIIIQPDFSFFVYDLVENKQIAFNKLEVDQSPIRNLDDISNAIVETNGNFLSFIIQEQDNYFSYNTFSINGDFLMSDKFKQNETIVSSCIDSINKCHFTVVLLGNSQFALKRFTLFSGENPRIFNMKNYPYLVSPNPTSLEFVFMMISSLHRQLRVLINSQVSPSLFLVKSIDDFFKLTDMIEKLFNRDKKIHMIKGFKKATKEILIILVSLNLKRIECTSDYNEFIFTRMVRILKLFPFRLSCMLFFSNFDYFLFNQNDEVILILIELIKSMKCDHLLLFALRIMENSKYFPLIDFKCSNGLFSLIPQDCIQLTSINQSITIFLLLHQKCLVRETKKYLLNNPLAVINFDQKNERTILDLFGSYIENLFSIFQNILSINEPNEIFESLIYLLFSNFCRLLSNLVEFHTISRIATSFIFVIVEKLDKLIDLDYETVLIIIFIFGKFAATLINGGFMCEIEAKYLGLIKSNCSMFNNTDLINNLDSDEIEEFKDERINVFLNSEKTSIDEIYKKIKPILNKKLNSQIQQIDKLSLAAFSKHLNCLDEMLFFDSNQKPSQKLKNAFDLTISVRNEYRSLKQNNKDTSMLRIKCLMLLRMERDEQINMKLLGEFVTKLDASYFKKILLSQKGKLETTLVGFGLVNQIYNEKIDNLAKNIISYNLSVIESFEGLTSIMRNSKLNEKQSNLILSFFINVIRLAVDEDSLILLIVIFRFFNDINNLNYIKKSLLVHALKAFDLKPKTYSLFALSLSLIKDVDEVPSDLLRIENTDNEFRWAFLAEASKYALPPIGFIRSFIDYLWNYKSFELRFIFRVIYNIQKKITSPYSFFESYLRLIGEKVNDFNDLTFSSELIYFFRRILVNPDSFLHESLINFILTLNPATAQEEIIIGLFSVLGLNFESIRPYSIVNYHKDRKEMIQFYAIPQNDNEISFYPKPFHVNSKIEHIPISKNMYAIPRIDVQPEDFPHYQFLFSFHQRMSQYEITNPFYYVIYMQFFSSFCRNSEFISKINSRILRKLLENPLSIHDIQDTIDYVKTIKTKDEKYIVDQVSGFNILFKKSSAFKTFLSPALNKNVSSFEVNITFPTKVKNSEMIFVGIVSDNFESYYTRYSIVSYPEGKIYPSINEIKIPRLGKNTKSLKIRIENHAKQFLINDKEFPFPPGVQFRIILITKMEKYKNIIIDINSDDPVFDDDASPSIQSFDIEESNNLYQMPDWVFEQSKNLPFNISELPDFQKLIKPIDFSYQLKYFYSFPPINFLIHGAEASNLSFPIVNCLEIGCLRKLSYQYSTLSLMRIAIFKPRLIAPASFKLFKHAIILLESFSRSKSFPFGLENPVWKKDVDPIYMSLENEVKKSLQNIISDIDNIDIISSEIQKLFESKAMHTLMYPQRKFHILNEINDRLDFESDGLKLFFYNDFFGKSNEVFEIHHFEAKKSKNKDDSSDKIKLPCIHLVKAKQFVIKTNRQIGILSIDPDKNDWIINTPFEFLLLLKNFIFASHQKHRPMIKSIIIDSFLINSPIISYYLKNFVDFIQIQIPSTPIDQDSNYLCHLALLGSCLKVKNKNFFLDFYKKEQRLVKNKTAAQLARHFPEFFSTSLPEPESNFCQIPPAAVHGEELGGPFSDYILTLKLFSRSYDKLTDFPFWEILPFWIHVTGRKDTNNPDDSIIKIEKISTEVIKITNRASKNINATIVENPANRIAIPSEAILMCSKSSNFDEANYVEKRNFSKSFVITPGETFISLNLFIDNSNPWNIYNIRFDYNNVPQARSSSSKGILVDSNKIKNDFINDMIGFCIKWNESHTNELINQIPMESLKNKRFDEVEAIARTSNLTLRFGKTVVVLHSLIIYHYNYIYFNHNNEVNSKIWNNFNNFLSIDAMSELFLANITSGTKFNLLIINRRKAQSLCESGKGSRDDSIISQLSFFVSRNGAETFQNNKDPWKVKFVDEEGIDVGGVTRELFVETTNSIFEKTSQLMVQVDASINGINRMLYVPNEKAVGCSIEYYTIGVFIGMVIRTGYLQDLPFAPIVWKWIAGEFINDEDVFESDRIFRESFTEINKKINDQDYNYNCDKTWSVVGWNGIVHPLPNRNMNENVSSDEDQLIDYKKECIEFRKKSIKPMLDQMKKGFFDNIQLKNPLPIKGLCLSKLAQGSGKITFDDFKKYTYVKDFSNDDNAVIFFWRAISRFNENELKLLFKFMTSLTRIPNTSRVGKEFRMKIDPLNTSNPDASLPMASTCFYALHLPRYSNEEIAYQKILYAVKNCSTMENL